MPLITFTPSKQYDAATAYNCGVVAQARPGRRLVFSSPSDFDQNGHLIHEPQLRDWPAPTQVPGLPWFNVSQGPLQMIINNGRFLADQQLMQTSPDWKVRWGLGGRMWLCELGFNPSNDPFSPFQLPDTFRIYTELVATTDSVGEDWENATQHFPLTPPHLLLPIQAPPKPDIDCPYPYCDEIIDDAGEVDSHLALYHFIDDPECEWLTRSPRESKDMGYECSCVYANGTKLNNAPLRMNKLAFFDHVHLKHFYAGIVYCRFCAISVDKDKYPNHILECEVLSRFRAEI